MQLAVSPTSFAAALTVVPAHSKSAIASAANAAYKGLAEQVIDERIKSRSLGEECSFASSGLRGNEADTGILGCAGGFVCVKDDHSSLGGYCVSADVKHRDLQHTPPCTTKCTGFYACKDLDAAFIATIPDGSCCGAYACMGITGEKMKCSAKCSLKLHSFLI